MIRPGRGVRLEHAQDLGEAFVHAIPVNRFVVVRDLRLGQDRASSFTSARTSRRATCRVEALGQALVNGTATGTFAEIDPPDKARIVNLVQYLGAAEAMGQPAEGGRKSQP